MKKIVFLVVIVLFYFTTLLSEAVKINDNEFSIHVLESNNNITRLKYDFGSFEKFPVIIGNKEYFRVNLINESVTFKNGYPELPKITRSIIIPDDAKMETRIVNTSYVDFKIDIAPSKGLISRELNPDDKPYEFSEFYSKDIFYPETQVEIGKPYILRDYRGIVVNVYPFSYNPESQILRVYHSLEIEIYNTGIDSTNIKTRYSDKINGYFVDLYKRHFINFDNSRYTSIDEYGRIIVICYDSFASAIDPYVSWKKQKGVQTDFYNVSSIGSTANDIKSFIQSEYNAGDGLTFVQLVGDAAQIPTFTHSGGGSDPTYALVDGGDDYPDIFIGRFSAENTSDLDTQVERTVHYEKDISTGSWLHKGTGIASAQGAGVGDDGEADWEHEDVIRGKLLAYTYSEIDQFYDTVGATASDVTNALNIGRGIINYTGHGGTGGWATTGFNNSHVNALENDYMLPFIQSVACVNGNFTSSTCFAEAWLRATNNSNGHPTGAIAMYASSINQSWAPPMRAQDEAIDLLVGDYKNTIGGLWYNGSCNMIDVYGSAGVDMYKTWHIFGDASLQVRTNTPTSISVTHDPNLVVGQTTFFVNTDVSGALVCLFDGTDIISSDYTDSNGDINLTFSAISETGSYYLTVSAYNKITHVETIIVGHEGTWTGNTSSIWNNANNWFGGSVPDISVDVIIPAGTPNDPCVSSSNAECRNLEIESGASLTIHGKTLDVQEDVRIFGHLIMDDNSSILNVLNNLFWRSGSTADITGVLSEIKVHNYFSFSSGANVQIEQGDVRLVGSSNSAISSYEENCYLNNLRILKTGAQVDISGEFTDVLNVHGDLVIGSSSTLINSYEANDILLKGDLICNGTLWLQHANLNFEGSIQSINTTPGDYFNNITFNSTDYTQLLSDITVKGDLELDMSSLVANNHEISLEGDWVINQSYPGTFNADTGIVTFNGSNDQTCNGSSFNVLNLHKPSGHLIIPSGSYIQCDSYNWTQGILEVDGGQFTAHDLYDNSILGTYVLNSGQIDLHQDASHYVDVNGSIIIYGGNFNIHGGVDDCWFAHTYDAYLYMAGGILDVKDWGIHIDDAHSFAHVISGGVIKMNGGFSSERHDFGPIGGYVWLYGSDDVDIDFGWGNTFHNLTIDKSLSDDEMQKERNTVKEKTSISRRREPLNENTRAGNVTIQDDLEIDGELNITNGTFNLNGHYVQIDDSVEIEGTLKMISVSDYLDVGEDVIWKNGSSDVVSAGEIYVGRNWRFEAGTIATLGVGNTVIFTGTAISEIFISEFDNAEFGNVILDKTGNYTTREMFYSSYMKVKGDLTLNANNEFRTEMLDVDGDIFMDTGSELIVNWGQVNANGDVECNGSINLNGGNLISNQEFLLNSGGEMTINGGDFFSYKPYSGNFLTFAGTLNLVEGNFTIWDENVRFTTTPNITNATIQLGRGIQATQINAFQPSGGTVEFFGNEWSNIDVSNGNYFHNLTITKNSSLRGCMMNDDLVVNNDLTINSGKLLGLGFSTTIMKNVIIGATGVLDPSNELLQVGGDWTNNRGAAGFVEGTGTVSLFGNYVGTLLTDETFYNLELNRDTGSLYYSELADGVTVRVKNNFEIMDGKLLINDNATLDVDKDIYMYDDTGIRAFDDAQGVQIKIGSDFYDYNSDNTDYTSFIPGSSTVTCDGDSMQVIYSNRYNFDLDNLIINKTGGYFNPYINLTIQGDLNILNGYWNNPSIDMTHTLMGDVSICADGWVDNMGTVIFAADHETTFERSGTGVDFYNVYIGDIPRDDLINHRKKGFIENLTDPAGNKLVLNSGFTADGFLNIDNGQFDLNGNECSIFGGVSIYYNGKLTVDENAMLKIGDYSYLNVNDGGELEVLGSNGNEATITEINYGYPYFVNIYSGGTISAEYGIFEYMASDGVFVWDGGIVDAYKAFNNCTFQNGTPQSWLLRIENDQNLSLYNVNFPENTWGSLYNVYKDSFQGELEFFDATGDFAGEDYEYDPYGRIDWIVEAKLIYDPPLIAKILESGESEIEPLTLGNAGNVDVEYLAYVEYETTRAVIINEGFESSFPPTGWTLQSLDGWGNWEQCYYYGHEGSYSAQANPMMVDDARLITPFFTATPDCILKYWIRAYDPDFFWENAVFEIEVSTDGASWSTLKSYSQDIFTDQYVVKGLALGSYTGQSIKIAFRVQNNMIGSGVNIDDVVITGDSSPAYSWLTLDGAHNISGVIPVGSPNVGVDVGFNATGLADGEYNAFIRLISNDYTDPYDNIPVSLNVGTYEMTITPTVLNFGEIEVGYDDTKQFTIENTGTLEIFGEVTAPIGFEVWEDLPDRSATTRIQEDRIILGYFLLPNEIDTYNVKFLPSEAIDYDDFVIITHNMGGADETVQVTGSGILLANVTTSIISGITFNAASGGGEVTSDGNSNITARGVCWSTSASPTISDNHTTDGTGIGTFVSSITGLNPETFYYVRAYATNSLGTAYGTEVTFSTLDTPLITVSVASLPDFGNVPINTSSAEQSYTVSGNNLTADLTIDAPTGFEISLTAESDNSVREKPENLRDFGAQIILSPTGGTVSTTTIYVRFSPTGASAYSGNITHTSVDAVTKNVAVSGTGITYATISTESITNITQTTAESGGNITTDGGSFVTARGVCWSTSNDPTLLDDFTTDGDGTGTFVSSLTSLTPDTHYYVRAYATNSVGTSYGDELEFDTLPDLPPDPPTNLTINISGGNIILSWDVVTGADSYKVYSSDEPYTGFDSLATVTDTIWSTSITEEKKFYYVVASSEMRDFLPITSTRPKLISKKSSKNYEKTNTLDKSVIKPVEESIKNPINKKAKIEWKK